MALVSLYIISIILLFIVAYGLQQETIFMFSFNLKFLKAFHLLQMIHNLSFDYLYHFLTLSISLELVTTCIPKQSSAYINEEKEDIPSPEGGHNVPHSDNDEISSEDTEDNEHVIKIWIVKWKTIESSDSDCCPSSSGWQEDFANESSSRTDDRATPVLDSDVEAEYGRK
ncbi:hypothetical protein BD770DRAFT_408660 [Pilaira anomala]|nr:hypothetical protein BD770DRAFT_408660 [Pilaira anomala]